MWRRHGGEALRVSKKPDWQLAFVLPNLHLEDRNSSAVELTLGLEGIAIVPTTDPRVSKIRRWSSAADRFLGCFHDGNGEPITPAALIVRDDWNSDMNRSAEPVMAFRNAVAVASILPARARRATAGWQEVSWSDTFDYHPGELSVDGSMWNLWTPALTSIGFILDGLSLTPNFGLPRTRLGPMDRSLEDRLGRAWSLRFRRKRKMRDTAKIFRSLEAAYEALAMRFRSYESLNERGLGTVPWATAVEVLASPPNRNVNKFDCIKLIGQAPTAHAPDLQYRRYWVWKDKKKKQRVHMTLTQRLFFHLHTARSKFVHGDQVAPKLLLPFGKGTRPVLSTASTVYRAALISYLEKHWPREPPIGDVLSLMEVYEYEKHLLKAVDR